jgi:hypothetical protein
MKHLLVAFSIITLAAVGCASPSGDDTTESSGAATVAKPSTSWLLKCVYGKDKGKTATWQREPSARELLNFCRDGIGEASQVRSANGKAVWTIQCELDKLPNGTRKTVEVGHEPAVDEIIAACPADYAGADPYPAEPAPQYPDP